MTRIVILLAAAFMMFGFRGSDSSKEDSDKNVTYTLQIDSEKGGVISFEGAYLSQDNDRSEFKHISEKTPFTVTVRSSRLYCLFKKTSGEGNFSIDVTGDIGGKKWKVNSGSTGNAAAIIYDNRPTAKMTGPSGIHLF